MSTSVTSSSSGNSRVAIVTGGTANLGKLFAESLAGDGVNLVVHYNSPHRAQEAADIVNELKGSVSRRSLIKVICPTPVRSRGWSTRPSTASGNGTSW